VQRWLLAILVSILALVGASSGVAAGCIEPALLAHSTVGITRYFDANEMNAARPDVVGASGTGWFLSPVSLVTVEHVAAGMKLSDQSWKQIEIRNGDSRQSIAARIQRTAGGHVEKIAVLELQTAVVGVRGFQLRMEPLVAEEPTVSLAYPDAACASRAADSCNTAKATGSQARRCSRCMMETTAWCSITEPRGRRCSIAPAEWPRSSATCS
jgi:hypothetical protein